MDPKRQWLFSTIYILTSQLCTPRNSLIYSVIVRLKDCRVQGTVLPFIGFERI